MVVKVPLLANMVHYPNILVKLNKKLIKNIHSTLSALHNNRQTHHNLLNILQGFYTKHFLTKFVIKYSCSNIMANFKISTPFTKLA